MSFYSCLIQLRELLSLSIRFRYVYNLSNFHHSFIYLTHCPTQRAVPWSTHRRVGGHHAVAESELLPQPLPHRLAPKRGKTIQKISLLIPLLHLTDITGPLHTLPHKCVRRVRQALQKERIACVPVSAGQAHAEQAAAKGGFLGNLHRLSEQS